MLNYMTTILNAREPVHEISVLITSASNEGTDSPEPSLLANTNSGCS